MGIPGRGAEAALAGQAVQVRRVDSIQVLRIEAVPSADEYDVFCAGSDCGWAAGAAWGIIAMAADPIPAASSAAADSLEYLARAGRIRS